METDRLKSLFQQYFGLLPETVTLLKASGSNRKYFRLTAGEKSAIGVVGESLEENCAFVELAKHFEKQNLPTPRVFLSTENYEFYLQEDLGSADLINEIQNGITTHHFSEKEIALLRKTISLLPKFQFEGAENLDFSVCFPQPEFDKRTIMWDLNYFKYCFLKTTPTPFLETKLEDEFERMANDLTTEKTSTFLYRDFQSRNIMIKDGEPIFIDFQGGRKGPIYYDVASFVFQAKANYPQELKDDLIAHYVNALQVYRKISVEEFKEKLNLFVFFRTLQVLGAYGFRGKFEQKQHFIESIPFALKNLQQILPSVADKYPYLYEILTQMCAIENSVASTITKSDLVVTVMSFSFKKGIPVDNSGNGGGYIFDCRGMHNPGRYDEYKQLTGLDKPVIDFLEHEGEIQKFLKSVYDLADAHIQNYIKRNFSNLMFCFGCTGGQHRSVYSAQHTAEYIAKKYGVKVNLIHREQNIQKTL